MAKRGRVLRDPYAGPGLLMVEGRQYPFLVEGLWRSEVPARAGLAVNVDFDVHGNLNSISAAPEFQVERGQSEFARAGAGVRNTGFDRTPATGRLAQFAASILLVLSWSFMTTVAIRQPFLGRVDLSFWQVLGYLNAGNLPQISEFPGTPDSGLIGFLAILVLAGPFLYQLWDDRRALLGGILPLSFMMLVAYMVRSNAEPFNAVSVGLGTYLSLSLAIYLAVVSMKQFGAASRTSQKNGKDKSV